MDIRFCYEQIFDGYFLEKLFIFSSKSILELNTSRQCSAGRHLPDLSQECTVSAVERMMRGDLTASIHHHNRPIVDYQVPDVRVPP